MKALVVLAVLGLVIAVAVPVEWWECHPCSAVRAWWDRLLTNRAVRRSKRQARGYDR